jgi:GDP-mannose 4,6-dehydratase
MKKALITGITGMVGSHLADYLLENTNWQIFGTIRWRSNLENINHLINLVNKKKRVFLRYGELNDPSSLDEVIKEVRPDYVFHLAAQSYPKTSFSAPIDTFNTNINGTMSLLQSIKKFSPNCMIHVCSSSEVFGRVRKKDLPIKESNNFHPASPYAISKVGTDLVGRFFAEAYSLKVITTRMFTHTGPRRGDVFAESTFAKQIALIENKKIPPIIKVGNLNSLRTIADVRDAVRAYHILLTKKPIPGEVYNIGGDYVCKIGDILDYLIKISKLKKYKIKIDKDRLRPIDADLQIPDMTKFKRHTGWEPKFKFQTTMKDLLNYWRKKVKSQNFLDR